MGGGGSKQWIQQHLKTKHGIETTYNSNVDCSNTGNIIQGSYIHAGGPISGVTITADAGITSTCDARDAIELLANTEIDQQQFSELKNEISQKGFSFFQGAGTDQNIKQLMESEITIKDVKDMHKKCTEGGDINQWTNWVTDGSVMDSNVYLSAFNEVECMLSTDTATEYISKVDAKQEAEARSKIEQKGIDPNEALKDATSLLKSPFKYALIAFCVLVVCIVAYLAYKRHRNSRVYSQQPGAQPPVAAPYTQQPLAYQGYQPLAQQPPAYQYQVSQFGVDPPKGLRAEAQNFAIRKGAAVVGKAAAHPEVQKFVKERAAAEGGELGQRMAGHVLDKVSKKANVISKDPRYR